MAERKTQTVAKCEAKMFHLQEQIGKLEKRGSCRHDVVVTTIHNDGYLESCVCNSCGRDFKRWNGFKYQKLAKKVYKRLTKEG